MYNYIEAMSADFILSRHCLDHVTWTICNNDMSSYLALTYYCLRILYMIAFFAIFLSMYRNYIFFLIFVLSVRVFVDNFHINNIEMHLHCLIVDIGSYSLHCSPSNDSLYFGVWWQIFQLFFFVVAFFSPNLLLT